MREYSKIASNLGIWLTDSWGGSQRLKVGYQDQDSEIRGRVNNKEREIEEVRIGLMISGGGRARW